MWTSRARAQAPRGRTTTQEPDLPELVSSPAPRGRRAGITTSGPRWPIRSRVPDARHWAAHGGPSKHLNPPGGRNTQHSLKTPDSHPRLKLGSRREGLPGRRGQATWVKVLPHHRLGRVPGALPAGWGEGSVWHPRGVAVR